VSEALLAPSPDAWAPALEAVASDPRALETSDIAARTAAFERYRLSSANRERPGRYWKIDLDTLHPAAARSAWRAARAEFSGGTARGVVRCDLATAAREEPAVFNKAFRRALAFAPGKYAALAQALHSGGAFIYLPADVCVDEPIVISYRAEAATATFPYTLIVAEKGSSATIIEKHESNERELFVCGITEVIAESSSSVTHAAVQRLPEDAVAFFTRAASLQQSARLSWGLADLGAYVSGSTVVAAIEGAAAESHIAAIFFPCGEQHVDFVTAVDHLAGQSQSRTVVKSAAAGNGQARYLGNIRIAANEHGCDASLKDDALLLSPGAHIDSVPALEIAANDVKAFHGATVGALDEEMVFYMTTRGLEPAAAKRMITLGFFEPAIEHFPTNALRELLRSELARKIGA